MCIQIYYELILTELNILNLNFIEKHFKMFESMLWPQGLFFLNLNMYWDLLTDANNI
jgi:hypothetical protein